MARLKNKDHLPKTTSPYIVVRKSMIHSRGVFARKDIPAGTRIIEYVGEKITKAESDRRAEGPLNRYKKNQNCGAVYLFELNKRYDIDGDVPYNTARFINHSCDPNCETEVVRGHIWITALQDIQRGEELTYNYGYDYEAHEEHPCYCGKERCVGYILAEEHWSRLKRKKRREAKKEEIEK